MGGHQHGTCGWHAGSLNLESKSPSKLVTWFGFCSLSSEETHTHTHISLSVLFPSVPAFHIYGKKTMPLSLNWPFGGGGVPGATLPKPVSAACFTKIRSLLLCGAAAVPTDTGPGKEPKGEWEPLGFLCTCAPTISKSMVSFLKSMRNGRSQFQPQCLAFPSFCCCSCFCLLVNNLGRRGIKFVILSQGAQAAQKKMNLSLSPRLKQFGNRLIFRWD